MHSDVCKDTRQRGAGERVGARCAGNRGYALVFGRSGNRSVALDAHGVAAWRTGRYRLTGIRFGGRCCALHNFRKSL